MKFKTLNNKEIYIDVRPSNFPLRSKEDSKSYGQYNLGLSIRSIYGEKALILEEFPLPEERLWLDFYLPHHCIAFEYQGKQHDEFSKFFHGNKQGFKASKKRDAKKRQWCIINDITLVEVRGNVDVGYLKKLITKCRNNE